MSLFDEKIRLNKDLYIAFDHVQYMPEPFLGGDAYIRHSASMS